MQLPSVASHRWLHFVVLTITSFWSDSSLIAQVAPTSAGQLTAAGELDSLKPLINPTTLVVAQLDIQRLRSAEAALRELQSQPETAPLSETISSLIEMMSSLSEERVTVMVDLPFTSAQSSVRWLARQTPSLDMNKLNQRLASYRFSPAIVQSGYVATTPSGMLARSNKLLVGDETLPANHAHLNQALMAVAGEPIQVAVLPPPYLWKSYEELMPNLPAAWGGIPTTTITHGMRWAAIGFDPATLRLRISIQSNSPEAAQRLSSALPELVKLAAVPLKLPANGAEWLPSKATVVGDRIEVAFDKLPSERGVIAVAAQLLQSILGPMSLQEKEQRFKLIALAIHNYVAAHQVLPPNQAGRRPDGTSYLSWRVHILPFLGEDKLYSQFHLDEPWDSEHNLPLSHQVPDVFAYRAPGLTAPHQNPGLTTIVAPVGEGTIFGGNKPILWEHVVDGLSNTILFLEVNRDQAVPWSAPQDYDFSNVDPAAGLEAGADGHFLCAMADGSVHHLPTTLPPKTLLHLFQMNDRQEIKY